MKIFISYQNQSWPLAKELGQKLTTAGHLVHWDFSLKNQGGAPFNEKIASWIADSEIFIFLITPQSLASAWCNAELGFAKALQKTIIPVKFEGIQNYQVGEIPFLGKRQILTWVNHEDIFEKIQQSLKETISDQMISVKVDSITADSVRFTFLNISSVAIYDVRVFGKISYFLSEKDSRTTFKTWSFSTLELGPNGANVSPTIALSELFSDKKIPQNLISSKNFFEILIKFTFQNQERDFSIFKKFPLA